MNGFININKEGGASSHAAVAAIRRLLHIKKVGHAGTLDPMATGVLPLCIGKATRLADYLTLERKTYLARIVFGAKTDSYDADGAIIAQADASHLLKEDILALLPQFIGDISQIPPVISAIKKDGVPLYKRARRGEEVVVPARQVHIYDIKVKDACFGIANPYLDLEIDCGKGTYIRSIAHDLGEKAGNYAHLGSLVRLKVGNFEQKDGYTLGQIEQMVAANDYSFIIPMPQGIAHIKPFTVPDKALNRLLHGNEWRMPEAEPAATVRVMTTGGQLLGIGHIDIYPSGGYALYMDKVLADNIDIMTSYTAVAIGNFDGIHMGHQQLVEALKNQQEKHGGKVAIITFKPHPLQLIKGISPTLLNTALEKQHLLKDKWGIDELIELDFNALLMNLSPRQFIEEIVVKRYRAQQVIVGFNFSFGYQGRGKAADLEELGIEFGFRTQIIQAVKSAYGLISSSNIRQAIQRGDIEAANAMLGYWYPLSGMVIKGQQLGRSLGYPTANFLPPPNKVLPPCGVFAVRVWHQDKVYPGILNFGYKPTINGGEKEPLFEAHLFDVDINLYGEEIKVELGLFIRGEQQFAGLEELTKQIEADSNEARKFLKS